MKFAIQRKTGYMSPYSLGMVYPASRRSREFGEPTPPIFVSLPFGSKRWIEVRPGLVRFPSWVSRKARNLTCAGHVKGDQG